MDGLSIDQVSVFLAVVREGSFSAAARALGRAPSAVTYAVQNMENQLDTVLFDRSHYRPTLTDAGSVLLPHARRVLEEFTSLRLAARGMANGLEAEVTLAIDSMFPMHRIFEPLKELQYTFPSVRTRIFVESYGSAVKLVTDRVCGLGLLSRFALGDLPMEMLAVAEVTLIVVASADHPLALVRGPLSPEDLRRHVQLVLADTSGITGSRDYGVYSRQSWRLGDLGAKHAMLRAGLGYGSLPRHMVEDDLDAGILVALEVAERSGGAHPASADMILAWQSDEPLGPATKWLRTRLSNL